MKRVGLLNLHKPPGVTSRHVVDQVERLVRPAKAGHAGTLDPLAEGVLVVCVGAATRLIDYVQRMPKRYVGTFLLGRTSPTEDIEGEVTLLDDPPQPTLEQIERAAARFLGEIQQRPPAFSALKVSGQRAYDLARAGREVTLAPRPVMIHALHVRQYAYPVLVLEIECGSGTYVRSLGRDLAESLGTSAVMSALVRMAIGGFTLECACKPDELSRDNLEGHMLPMAQGVTQLPSLMVNSDEARRLAHGLAIERAEAQAGGEWAAFDSDGVLLAILTPRGMGQLGPMRNFPRDAG
jgi:tRNA pseudouridine55 synthase